MEQYSRAQEDGFNDTNTNYDAGIEAGRPSAVFSFGKFGKAVASAWHGIWKDKELPALPEKDTIVDDRKAQAGKAYAELKKSGFQGTKLFSAQRESMNASEPKNEESHGFQHSSFRDSAIDIEEFREPSLDIIGATAGTGGLKPPMAKSKRSVSPMSDLTSGQRSSSLHLRTPSFQSLKKVKSQIHIPSIMRPAMTAPPLPTNEPLHPMMDGPPKQGLRRQPSLKNLAKYQRLTKKVSDLESKLDNARRDLQQSLRDAPPVPELPAHLGGRKPFTPGALASLPSERLLALQTTGPSVARTNTEIYGPAIVSSPSAQLGRELQGSFGGLDTLLSSDPLHKLDTAAEEQASWVASQSAKAKRKPSSSRKSEPRNDIDGRIPTGIKKQRGPKVPSRTPKNSPARNDETAPPVTSISITTDAANRPRSESSFLGRPGMVSPIRTRSKTQKRGISSPPSSLASGGKKQRVGVYEDETAMVDSPGSSVGKGKAPQQQQREFRGTAKAMKVEKPLPPVVQTEEFEWDEDVF